MALSQRHPQQAEPAVYKLQSNKTAMLVIHGIGEQNPYETLDSFARGVFTFLRDRCGMKPELRSETVAHKDWTQVAIRIDINTEDATGEKTAGYVDLYEYYWAPYTEDKISARQTLEWLIRTDLSPLRYLANNLQELAATDEKKTVWRFLWLFIREIRRIFLYLPIAAGLIWLLIWLLRPHSYTQFLQSLAKVFREDPWWARPAILAFYGLGVFLVIFMIKFLAQWIKRRGPSMQRRAEVTWFACAVISAALFFWLAVKLPVWSGVSMDPIWQILGSRGMWVVLSAAAFAAAWRYVLTKYVGDVAVYVTADAKSGNYEARTKILDGSTEALARLLASEDYDRVILAGHSLGSVIAYDTVNELITRVTAIPGRCGDYPQPPLTMEQLEKLRGLVTFGSPLDKIYYFFRQQVKEDQAIRAQILSMLHSFRKVSSGRDYGQFKFSYDLPKLEQLTWLNAWSPLDPVSGKLHFYNVKKQDWFFYPIPGVAHLGYWRDPKFYSFICQELLVER